jgi:hypothetical protein
MVKNIFSNCKEWTERMYLYCCHLTGAWEGPIRQGKLLGITRKTITKGYSVI